MIQLWPTGQTETRYERKFLVEAHSQSHVESLVRLHPAMFSQEYPERSVNNIYFDSYEKTNWLDNEWGLSERAKLRIRWYGDFWGYLQTPILEVKLKRNTLGAKLRFRLTPFLLERGFMWATLNDVLSQSTLPPKVREELAGLEPTLANRYLRRYYVSNDKKYRLTLDSHIEYYGLSHLRTTFFNTMKGDNEILLELKYAESEDARVDEIAGFFPYRAARNSKYVNGMNLLSYW